VKVSGAKLGEPFTFFVDRSLGSGIVPAALRRQNEQVIVHDDHFRQPHTPDVVWLGEAGTRGWVVLTKDARIRTNILERTALLSSSVAAFMLGRGDLRGEDMARAFVLALPRMKTVLRRCELPLIATVSVEGCVSVLYANGERLARPRAVK
jgi:hypothetical protein